MFLQFWIVFVSSSTILQFVSSQQVDQQIPIAQPPRMPAQAKSPVWLNNAPAEVAAQVNQLINDKTKSQSDVQNGINSLLANVPDIAVRIEFISNPAEMVSEKIIFQF